MAMRLVSYDSGAGFRAGELRDGQVFDLWGQGESVREEDRTLSGLLRGGLLEEVQAGSGPACRPTPSRSCRRSATRARSSA